MQGMRVLGTATSLVKVTIGVSTARCLKPWREPRSKMKLQRSTNSFFVLGEAASGHEVGEDDNVIGEVIVTVGVFPYFELDVDVASEVAEGCADAVPVADCIIVVGAVAFAM